MREVEIKVEVKSHDAILKVLDERGITVSTSVAQHDRVYAAPGETKGGTGAPWLRIRSETKNGETTHTFTLKRSFENHLDKIEHETSVDDSYELEKIIENMNFVPFSDLTKTRRKAKLGDIEICLDEVRGLGAFIEAEKLVADDAPFETVAAELWELFESLGASKEDEIHVGYDVLARQRGVR